MKRIILISIAILSSTLVGLCPPGKILIIGVIAPIRPYDALWEAVCTVESNNDVMALNRLELAHGIAQIRPIRLKDYNQRTGKSYKIEEMYDPIKSKEVFLFYCHKFHFTDLEHMAKRWNGRGKKTIEYWKRVKSVLNESK